MLGGLGPEATLDFFAKVLKSTSATSDQEHLHLIIDNNPKVHNRNDAVAGLGPSPGPQLAEMAKRLEGAGADFLVMVCNAAHAFQGDILEAVRIPFVSIIEETVAATLARAPEVGCAGVLAASACLDTSLYDHAFASQGVSTVTPQGESRERFMTLLYRIKAGNTGAEVQGEMIDLAMELCARGAEVIVAGCTEVPLVLTERSLPCELINSTDVLVEATIAYATGARALPGALIS